MIYTTVVIPVYQRHDYLEQAIASVLSQTDPHWRLLVAVDDAFPTLGVFDILDRMTDPRASWVAFPHKNQCSALNQAVRLLKTPFATRLDSDDLLAPDAIEALNKAIITNPDAGYFYTSRMPIDKDGNPLTINGKSVREAEPFSPTRLEEGHMAQVMITWRNSEFITAGGFDEDQPYAEDYLLPLTMMLHGTKFVPINHLCYYYRFHESGNISAGYANEQKKAWHELARKKYLEKKKAMGISWAGEDPGTMRPWCK